MGLSRTDTISDDDLMVLYKCTDADFRGGAMAVLISYMQGKLVFPGKYAKKYASPSATGFTVAFDDTSSDQHLVLKPGATYATGTITLPLKSVAIDGQKVLVNCTQEVTALTIAGNGASVTGAPTTITQNGYFTLSFDLLDSTWYRIG